MSVNFKDVIAALPAEQQAEVKEMADEMRQRYSAFFGETVCGSDGRCLKPLGETANRKNGIV
ncbi:hypothetical protein [Testudinibacter sp. TR-2022]|uniref:hypothetical protein n=1 Tax=Testudinibacter sp. TR-2022 TaxID=2585029 RepID=UPI0026D14875